MRAVSTHSKTAPRWPLHGCFSMHTLFELSDKLDLSFGIGTQWADQKYMQTYFGVTSLQADASRFEKFTGHEGFVSGSVQIGLEYRL